MAFNKSEVKKLGSALDLQRYRKAREKKYPETSYVKLVDKFLAGKPVSLTEMNEICASDESCWAYVKSLLHIIPTHVAMALEQKWNGEAIANGMVLAHAITRATVFLPADAFLFVFASLLRPANQGGITFTQVAAVPEKAVQLSTHWHQIFSNWISDVITSREHTLDVAMHNAALRLVAIVSALAPSRLGQTNPKTPEILPETVQSLLLGMEAAELTVPEKMAA